jgi:hypothetical protein
MSRYSVGCGICGSKAARIIDRTPIKPSDAERLVLDLSALVGIKVSIHRVRLVGCPDCIPGRVTRHRELVIPLEAEYPKSYLRSHPTPKKTPLTGIEE